MPVFHLLRHAKSGVEGIYYGRRDVAVTPEGSRQEEEALDVLKGRSFHAIVTSPLSRCHNLAERIANHTGAPLDVDHALVEIDIGDWEGRTFDEASNIYRDIASQMLDYDPQLTFPGGESLAGFRDRAIAAWTDVASRYRDARGDILIVCHAGVIQAILAGLLHESTREFWNHNITNCSITTIHANHARERIVAAGQHVKEAFCES